MGRKRKSRVVLPPRKRLEKLETVFRCPFCDHPDTVQCRIDLKLSVGVVECRVCRESFSTKAHHLSEPIDIYTEWIDECELVNRPEEEVEVETTSTTVVRCDGRRQLGFPRR